MNHSCFHWSGSLCRLLFLWAVVLLWISPAAARPLWHRLEQGLDLQVYGDSGNSLNNPGMVVLRIDPSRFTFLLLSSSQAGIRPLGMDEWVSRNDLVAAINASMYWEDQTTSTGYMRMKGHVNNAKVHPQFGAFFVTGPTGQGLPQVMIVDRSLTPDWKAKIAMYTTVVQNYRIVSSDGDVVWMNESKRFSMASIAADGEGNILFVLSRKPMTVREFGRELLKLSADIGPAMYVEGGPTASLYVRSKSFEQGWVGLDDFGLWSASQKEYRAVPNVIGVVRKIVTHR